MASNLIAMASNFHKHLTTFGDASSSNDTSCGCQTERRQVPRKRADCDYHIPRGEKTPCHTRARFLLLCRGACPKELNLGVELDFATCQGMHCPSKGHFGTCGCIYIYILFVCPQLHTIRLCKRLHGAIRRLFTCVCCANLQQCSLFPSSWKPQRVTAFCLKLWNAW